MDIRGTSPRRFGHWLWPLSKFIIQNGHNYAVIRYSTRYEHRKRRRTQGKEEFQKSFNFTIICNICVKYIKQSLCSYYNLTKTDKKVHL